MVGARDEGIPATLYAGGVKARTALPLLAVTAWFAASPAAAPGAGLGNAPAPPTVALPGDAGMAAVDADPATWIVGARTGAGALAHAYGARRIAGNAWLVPRGRARALAGALRARGLLDYAEPNRLARRAQAPAPDPLSPFATWRDFVVRDQVPPPVGPDQPADRLRRHADRHRPSRDRRLQHHDDEWRRCDRLPRHRHEHRGGGAGQRCRHAGHLAGRTRARHDGARWHVITCADSTRAIGQAIRAAVAVINMSYGAPAKCVAEEQQILRAVQAGAVPVAAAGNEFQRGNPLEYPASLAHVITVGAVGPDDRPTGFSNESGALDLSAPGHRDPHGGAGQHSTPT